MDGGLNAERILAPDTTNGFLWILIVGTFGAFFAAFGIGANDVANAFANSVRAKALTLRQAVVLAGIFEFLGAVFLGSHVTRTIRSGTADIECFTDNPGILMYGNMCVVYTNGIWLLLASFFELPVSTTHSTIGGIVGMTMTYRGADCVVWYEEADHFPYIKGIFAIVVSWALSPVLSGVVATLLFFVVRALVLRSEHALNRSMIVFPLLVTVTIAIEVFFVVYKGANGLSLDDPSVGTAFAWASGLGVGVGLLMIPTVLSFMRSNIEAKFNGDGTLKPAAVDMEQEATGGAARFVQLQLDQDVHATVKDNDYVAAIRENAERSDPRTEEAFKYVQVFTAICDSFSHGANDVANAMGPFAFIYIIYTTGVVEEEKNLGNDMFWILALGGAGIVAGLTIYGYKIISAIGVKIPKITPSRCFAIKLGSAIMIIIGTRLEIPFSPTHCKVGATTGVALLEGLDGINLNVVGKTVLGWITTSLVCGITCSGLFAQGAYAPYAYDTIDMSPSTSS
ncbi:unnamed protein product, partial [Ectocarpus sp. 6 AP-2014]